MAKIFINLKSSTTFAIGWSASISEAHTTLGAPNEVAIGESTVHNTKQQAWQSIQEKASQLNYVNNEVFFNQQAVTSFNDVTTLVAAL
jgi:hypothetical protein